MRFLANAQKLAPAVYPKQYQSSNLHFIIQTRDADVEKVRKAGTIQIISIMYTAKLKANLIT